MSHKHPNNFPIFLSTESGRSLKKLYTELQKLKMTQRSLHELEEDCFIIATTRRKVAKLSNDYKSMRVQLRHSPCSILKYIK
jgi:hypothetical protein